MMLAKCKKDSLATLCRPAKVAGCHTTGNASVSAGRLKWAGTLAEYGRQDVLLCVRHWSERYTACWHSLNNSLPGWGCHDCCVRVQGASSTIASASSWGHCSQHAGKGKGQGGSCNTACSFLSKNGRFLALSAILQLVLMFCFSQALFSLEAWDPWPHNVSSAALADITVVSSGWVSNYHTILCQRSRGC